MKLSIVIPAYNAERFLPRLLDNLSLQIAKENLPCEIIVVNDGSQDCTSTIGNEFATKFSFIRVIDQENKGESGARNTGIENAQGEYVYFLDCDDSVKEGSISHFIRTMDKNPNLDLYCFAYTSTTNGMPSKDYTTPRLDSQVFNQSDFLKSYLAKYLPVNVCSCVVCKKLIDQYHLRFTLGMKIGADVEWLLNVGSIMQSAYFSNRVCFVYQIRDDSIMQGYKTYSLAQYHSFEVFRDIVLSTQYQSEELAKYSNFWIENMLLLNIMYYLRSSVQDNYITQRLIADCSLFNRPIAIGAFKNLIAVLIAKILPLKLILKTKMN